MRIAVSSGNQKNADAAWHPRHEPISISRLKSCQPMALRLPIRMSGDFGRSPSFGQLSVKREPVRPWHNATLFHACHLTCFAVAFASLPTLSRHNVAADCASSLSAPRSSMSELGHSRRLSDVWACRLHPRLRTYRCGAAKCRDGPKADIEGELVICRDKDLRDD